MPTGEEEIEDAPSDEDYLCELNDPECQDFEDAEDTSEENSNDESEAKTADNDREDIDSASRKKILDDEASELNAPKNETATGEEEEEDENLDRLGSANILDNLGIMLFFLVVLILVVTLVLVLARVYRTNKKAQEIFRKVKEKLFWNTFIRFVV